MPALRDLQRDFADAVLRRAADALTPHIRGPGAEERALLYANTVLGTLSKALESIYPVIARLVGGRCFDGLARRFIRGIPSRSGDLHEFGGEFADFIAGSPLDAGYPYLTHVARLEWAMHRVIHARDAVPLDVRSLKDVAPARCAQLRFALAPASALLAAPYPVHRIWEANQPGHDGGVAIEREDSWLLLHRGFAAIEMIPLTRGEYALLSALRERSTLGVAIAAGMEAEAGLDPSEALTRAMERGVLVDFDIEERERSEQ